MKTAGRVVRAIIPGANLKSVAIAFSDSAKPQPLNARGLAYQSTPQPLPTNYDGQLRFMFEDWSGARYSSKLPLSVTAFSSTAEYTPDEGEYTDFGVWSFFAPFMIVLSATTLLWIFRFGHWRLLS